MAIDSLPVFYEHRRVGTIEPFEDGPTFLYDPAWLSLHGSFPISFLMPLSHQRVPSGVFEPWAANLLPEAEALHVIGRRLGASPADTIAILAEVGRDTAGALSIGQPGRTSAKDWRPIPDAMALERIINELPAKPFLSGEEGISMSLAGVQTKLSVAVDADGRICIPVKGAPSTHILKPDSPRLYGSVANEALCLVLAKLCGLAASDVTTGIAGQRSYLLVRRYDRIEQKGSWRRLHQEDYCQALGKHPAAKYEAGTGSLKGPSLDEMFLRTRNAMSSVDLLKLLDYVLFNVMVGNTDAHAKNYSMMISGRGFALAPLYDVLCTPVWDGITKNLAHAIAGKRRSEHLKRRHWDRFADASALSKPRLIKRIEQMAALIEQNADVAAARVAAMPAGPHAILQHCVDAIKSRVRMISAGLADLEGVKKTSTQ